MSYPLLQFVASPDTGAAVRFDFNTGTTGVDGSTEVLQDGFSLGSPTLQGDPDGIGTEYGFRELSIPLRINGTTTSAPAKFATLARELDRQTNWLRFQATATSTPYWFKTYRSAPEPLDWEQFRNLPDTTVAKWYADLKLAADPDAYGARETIGPVTISNNPASGTNPVSYALPDIKGDAPTPLAATIRPSTGVRGVALASTCQIAAGAGNDPAPYIWQAEAFTVKTDTSVVVDAAYSGGSKTVTTFATPTMMTRLSAQFDYVFGNGFGYPPPVGRYVMYARVGRSDTTSSFRMKTGVTPSVNTDPDWSARDGVVVAGTSNSSAWATWVNLGDLSLPPSAAQELPAGVGNGYGNSVALHVGAERLSGAGSLWIDAVMAVPAQLQGTVGTSLFATTHGRLFGSPDNALSVDGAVDSAVMSKNGSLTIQQPPPLAGSFPVVRPGAGNLFTLLLHCEATAIADNILTLNNDDAIATTSTVTFTYQPRWLYLAAS